MATLNASKIIRAPGRLIVNPTTAFASTSFPYGGTVLGLVTAFMLVPVGRGFTVWHEGTGEPGDFLEATKAFVASCFLRGWDNDALDRLRGDNSAAGAVSGHRVWSEPGTLLPGSSALEARGAKFVFVPDAPNHAPACVLYKAVMDWDEGARLQWGRENELGLPVSFQCARDASDRILKVGRLVDLPI